VTRAYFLTAGKFIDQHVLKLHDGDAFYLATVGDPRCRDAYARQAVCRRRARARRADPVAGITGIYLRRPLAGAIVANATEYGIHAAVRGGPAEQAASPLPRCPLGAGSRYTMGSVSHLMEALSMDQEFCTKVCGSESKGQPEA
jgi:hypothetical protein